VLADPQGSFANHSCVLADHPVTNDVSALDDVGVALGRELQSSNRDQGENNIRAPWPREILVSLDLHGQVHRGVVATLPGRSGNLVLLVSFPDISTNLAEVFVGETITEIRLGDSLAVEDDAGVELGDHISNPSLLTGRRRHAASEPQLRRRLLLQSFHRLLLP